VASGGKGKREEGWQSYWPWAPVPQIVKASLLTLGIVAELHN